MTFASQKNSFWPFVTVYDKVGDGDKYSHGNFGLGRPCFYATIHILTVTKIDKLLQGMDGCS